MNKQKSQLQRLQSRISKRRNEIFDVECHCEELTELPALKQTATFMRQTRKDLGESQKLDKELFQVLLEKERNKYARHFRSKYLPVSRFNKGEPLVVTA